MRRSIATGVILLFVLALVAGPSAKPAAAQKPSADRPPAAQGGGEPGEGQEARDRQEAKALIMIVGNPLRLRGQLSSDAPEFRMPADVVISSLITSWSQRAGERGEFWNYQVFFNHLSVSPEGHTLGILTVIGRGDATKILALAQKRLQEALLEIHKLSMDPFHRKFADAETRMPRAEDRIEQVTKQLHQLREMAAITGESLQPQDTQLFASVRRDHLALRAELAGLQAQREAIVEQIAKTKLKVDAAQKDQRIVLEELAQVVNLKEQGLARTRRLQQKGPLTQAEVSQAEVALAQARADLADHRRLLVNEAGGQQLGRLNEQLVDTQIAITTTVARLEETEKVLEDLRRPAYSPVSSLVIKYQQTRRALESAFAEQEAAAAELAKLKMAYQAIPAPKIIQIGGEAKPK